MSRNHEDRRTDQVLEGSAWPQQGAAGRAGRLQRRAISYWEAGRVRTVSSDYLVAMAGALECTVSELVGDPRLSLLIAEKQIEVAKEMVTMDSHINRLALLVSLRCDGLLPAIADEPTCDEQW